MKWFFLCCASQLAAHTFDPSAADLRVGQSVYDPQGHRVTVSSLFDDGTTVVEEASGRKRNYPGLSLGRSSGSFEGVSVGDRVYTSRGLLSQVEALYSNGQVLVDHCLQPGKTLTQVSQLGLQSGSVPGPVGEVHCADTVFTPTGVEGVVKCFYRNGQAYIDYSYKAGGAILAASSLGQCKGNVQGLRVGEEVYTQQGSLGQIQCFYSEGKALIDYRYKPGGVITQVGLLGRCSASRDGVKTGDGVFTSDGVFGVVKAIYPNGRAYVDYKYKSGGAIAPVQSLGVCRGSVLDVRVGAVVYTPRGIESHLKCFYPDGTALVHYACQPGGEVTQVSRLGLTSGSEGLIHSGDTVYTAQGQPMKVLAFFRQGQVLLDDFQGPQRSLERISTLGVTRSGMFDVQIGEEVISPQGDYGHILAVYPNEKALVLYSAEGRDADGGIFNIRKLKFKRSRVNPVQSLGSASAQERSPEGVSGQSVSASSMPASSSSSQGEAQGNEEELQSAPVLEGSSGVGGEWMCSQEGHPDHEHQKDEVMNSDQDLCKVCFDQELRVILIPCGHFVLCENCAEAITTCPICRKAIEARQKVYRS